MPESPKTIAVVRGAPSEEIQALLRDFVARWRVSVRIAGVIEAESGSCDPAGGLGRLQNITDGEGYPIFQDLGPGSQACRIDGIGVLSASEAVRRDIAAGCDLVVLSKFGKLESTREGLASAFAAAIEAELPILTAVSPNFDAIWRAFADPFFVILPAEAEAIDAWWRALNPAAKPEPSRAEMLPG